ncbi:unnamed protein product [Paramecium pentaurelia]|uniref:Acyl-CoA dehydrogenase family member 11 n=1 Tax=Paramecium pentaurelia TaxID=43138 RepID=A0A8S1WS20_9CILI|nr:unnamed protein product [Paramecium pentaurelia]
MSIQEVQNSHLLGTYLNSQSSLLVFLCVTDAQIEDVEQLAQSIYKISFKNTNKKIVLYTKSHQNNATAHQLEKDYVIVQKLSAVNYPVFRTLFYCADQSIIGVPFYATQYMEGRIFSDQKFIGMPLKEKIIIYQEVAKALAHLHSISLTYLGLEQLDQRTCNYQIVNKKFYNTYKLNETKISKNIEDLLYWLPLNLPENSELDTLCLIHGDFSLSKVLFHPTEPRILAILDWQAAQLGNAFTDLANLLSPYYIPYSNGIHQIDGWQGVEMLVDAPNLQDVIKSYFAVRSTKTIPDIRYQIIQAILKKSIDQQILFKQTKNTQYLANSEFLSEAGYQIILELTEGDPFGIKLRAEKDCALWSNWPVTDRCKSYYYRIKDFLKQEVFPIEKEILDKSRAMPTTTLNKGIPEIEILQRKAKSLGLWNLFISDPIYGKGLTNLEYVFLSELMGLSYLAHEIFNCFAPETGNMKLLIGYGTPYQKEKYLKPLLEGECKSFFAMTEKNVSSSDPNNFQFTITPTNGGYIINGGKWFVSSAPDERAKFGIVMGKSSQDMSNPMESQSMIIVDMPNPKIQIIRQLGLFSFYDLPHSYAEVNFDNVFVPKENLLGQLGGAFKMAQGRLLGGRLHHCVKQIGLTRRCLDLMISRASQRVIFNQKLKDNDAFQEKLGLTEIAIENCRLLSRNAGLLLDSAGSRHLSTFMAVSQCKAHIPKACQKMIDQCIQAFGAEGVTDDQPLAVSFRFARAIRFMDGPCEVHLRQIARFAFGNHLFNDLNNAQGYGLAKL